MKKRSAGIVMYKKVGQEVQLLLAHPGGPIWAKKDLGAWSIPKGEFTSEDPLEAALREFREEIGFTPEGEFLPLTPIQQKGGKVVVAFAVEGDCDPALVQSNEFEMEWPPRSGQKRRFPEIDRVDWFGAEEAKVKILTS